MKLFRRDTKPAWYVALIPIIVLVATIVFVIKVFGGDALSGASQVALLFAAGVTVLISMVFYKVPWKDFEDAITDNFSSIANALVILLLIGALAGSWMVSGVVPTLIYYGMHVITPSIFLFATCIISCLVSLMTGSSWTTIATIGVALIGIGTGQGYNPGVIAGAIISGAYFGDKVSPLSETTIMASSSAGTPLFTHIKYLFITTIPSIVISLIIFLVLSLVHDNPTTAQLDNFAESLKETFNINGWLLLVPLFTGILIAKKVPAMITLFCGSVFAGIAALVFQPELIWQVANADVEGAVYTGLSAADGFKGLMMTYYGPTSIDCGHEVLNNLVSTKGMTGMLYTIFLIMCAITFGGTMTGSGMIQSITNVLIKHIKGRTGLVAATVGTGIFCNLTTSDQYLSILLTSNIYKKLYKDNGFETRLLGRSVEDSATITSVLIPWNSCGMTQATVLKVATLDYLPYCFFNILSPLVSIFIAAIGYKIVRHSKGDEVKVDVE